MLMSTARLVQIDRQIGRVMIAVAEDPDASPELTRAVKGLYLRSQEAVANLRQTDGPKLRQVVCELEAKGGAAHTTAR